MECKLNIEEERIVQQILKTTKGHIMAIRDYIECGILPEEDYRLETFREEPEVIVDFINELNNSIKSMTHYQDPSGS